MPPTAREAAAILRARFPGLAPEAPEDDRSEVYGDPGGALALHALREGRAGELEDNLLADEAATLLPTEHYVQGEPGRRTRGNVSAAMSAHVGRGRLERLGAEIANDPDTGEAEQARAAKVRTALDDTMFAQRPEVATTAKTLAERNAFARKILKMGEYEAAASPAALEAAKVPLYAKTSDVGQRAANLDLEREQKLRMSPQIAAGQMPTNATYNTLSGQWEPTSSTTKAAADAVDVGGGFSAPPNLKPPSSTTERQLGDMQMVAPLVTSLEKLLDPTKNEVTDALTTRAKWGLYKMGVTPNMIGGDERDQARMQLASLISVAGATPYMRGTRAFQYLQQIQKHLTDPTATDAFLYQNIQELKAQWPKMYQKILQAHYNPGAPLTFDDDVPDAAAAPPAPTANDRRDPNRGR